MSTALKSVNTRVTPQQKPATPAQVKNNAGGYVFTITPQQHLERFLIAGVDGGTYYVGQDKHVEDNVTMLQAVIKSDEAAVVRTIVDVSVNARALKQSPTLFALAAVFKFGSDKAAARAAFSQVVRTSTHLFEFAQYIDNLEGWGRAKRAAVASWYTDKDVDDVAYQMVKYRQRNSWTHADILRLSHPTGLDPRLANFALGKAYESHPTFDAFREMQDAGTVTKVLAVLKKYPFLPWETIPTEFLKDPKVWKALFNNNQLNGQALVRNVTRLAKIGAFDDMKFAAAYAAKLRDENMIARTRLHPINYLNAAVVYNDGQVDRGGSYWSVTRKKSWVTSGVISDALDAGFYAAFKHVEPANKSTLVATDVSGSMTQPAIGLDLSCAQVSAAIAMTVARTEPVSNIVGFSTNIVDLGITANTKLNDAMKKVQKHNFGGTDASAAIEYARKKGIEVETFCVITDNETWAGQIHPFQALKKYRNETGIPARLAVLGVASTNFSIADSRDAGMMDFVGFDSGAIKLLTDFSAGRV